MARTSSGAQLKTILITGGGSGIGLETAKELLEKGGYRLVLVGRSKARLEDVAHSLRQLPGASEAVHVYACDLADSKEISTVLEKIIATHKGIFGLVNNAGVYPFGGLADTTEKAWDETFAVNLKGPFLLCQALVPWMRKQSNGGRIVNVSSTAGLLPNHFALAYSVSKAAMIQFTKTLAKELGKDNITVNCVCPGIVRTPLHDAYHATTTDLEHFYSKRGAAFPLGRVGEPKDVSAAIRFLLSDEASWITGDVLVVDGGRLLL
jgi:NAD(P)-dependent dehydrogenase (short-subunit alcohol dehydrogenase family)